MKAFVVDTSALLRLFIPDGPVPVGLEQALELAGRSESRVSMPGTAIAEAAQVVWKKERAGRITSPEADEILATILALPIDIVPDQTLATDALTMARRTGLTVYDSLFLTLALRLHASLVTADDELRRAWEREK